MELYFPLTCEVNVLICKIALCDFRRVTLSLHLCLSVFRKAMESRGMVLRNGRQIFSEDKIRSHLPEKYIGDLYCFFLSIISQQALNTAPLYVMAPQEL